MFLQRHTIFDMASHKVTLSLVFLTLLAVSMAKPQLVGGFSNGEVNDPKVQEMAMFAAQQMKVSSNARVEVLSVRTQVVAGVNYKMKIRFNSNGISKTCDVTVFDQHWTGTRELIDNTC